MTQPYALPADQLRWRVDESELPFKSTADVDPAEGIVGQPIALEAMRFGVETDAPGQNIYVRGVTGTGRMTLVRSMLQELDPKARKHLDHCYVHNFGRPDQPRLVSLPPGQGPEFRRRMNHVADFIQKNLGEALNAAPAKAKREAIKERTQQQVSEITGPLEKELKENGMTLVRVQAGPVQQTAIYPTVEGQAVQPDEFRALAEQGKVPKEAVEQYEEKVAGFSKRLAEVSSKANEVFQQGLKELQSAMEEETRGILQRLTAEVLEAFPTDAVKTFIRELIDDVIENRLNAPDDAKLPPARVLYGVNVVCSHDQHDPAPVIVENTPTVTNLLGTVEPDFIGNGKAVSNYRGIRAGALVHADGGFLILDARDVLMEPGAWRMLMRALRTQCVEIVPAELGWPYSTQSIKPEPIGVTVRVILLGSGGLYYQLDQVDQDFSNLFKVLADFNSEIDRGEEGIRDYAGVLARLVRDEDLPHFDAGGIAAMAEHGARIAARAGKVTARFGRVADIAREAALLARKDGSEMVGRKHVEETVRRTKYRASLPSKRFQELISSGTIRVDTSGEVVGQINGLAVINAGPLTYGFPSRITATISAGRAGIIDIEGASAMSGSIHTKGFHILGGCLRHLLQPEHPLAFSASLAFEQSYGGIDGDSASGAEFCCLVSALTDVPIRQSLAMTGAIDQHGHIQPIGGVNEKIEGFFDACKAKGLTGEQGVIIPEANAGDLMLRQDVVEACANGEFHVHSVSHVVEALEVLTGSKAGEPDASDRYPDSSIIELARDQATAYWKQSYVTPQRRLPTVDEKKAGDKDE